jgi:hypothetical protein
MLEKLEEKDELTIPAAIGHRPRWLPLTLVMATAAITVAIFPVATAFATDLGPGCATDRPAIAHHAGGVAAQTPKGETAPIPCVTNTGSRTSEIGVVVTNAGTVLFQPGVRSANATVGAPIGVLRSVDQGALWRSVDSTSPVSPDRTLAFDGNLGIDRLTGRVFVITPGYTEGQIGDLVEVPQVDISDEDGKAKTWYAGGEPVYADSIKVFAGPPPQNLKKLQQGYPNVVYNCGGHKPHRCERSRDGGLIWGSEVPLPFPPALAPIQGPNNTCSDFGLNGVVGRDGTVYYGYSPCNRPYIAISHDETDTWEAVPVADVETIGWGMTAVGIDQLGNLYAAFIKASDRLLYLSLSSDQGSSWSRPLMVGAPGVNEAALPRLVAGAAGQVAIAYYGSKNSPGAPFPPPCPTGIATSCPAWQNVTWNMYITETFNAFGNNPLFWSASINNPAQPAWYGCSASELGVVRLTEGTPYVSSPGFTGGCYPTSPGGNVAGGREDFFGMDMAPDNTPWIGFGQACPNGLPVSGNANCPSTLTGAPGDALWGLAGRLVRTKRERTD